ncbi:MAG: hypothetical protein D3916_07280 [Candidatus Electrothrix sp. MAN1_4]|nr:hypothetical protein [Candidatus Electrothrix sp. MAN1_4]
MKENIWKLLTDHAKWVFSGIGVFFITLIINSTCSNGAEDKNHTVTNISGGHVSGVVNSGVITYEDKISGDKISGDKVIGDKVTAETINREEYKDNSRKIEVKGGNYIEKVDGNYIENLRAPPSYREATIVQGENGNPVGVTDNPNVFNNAINLLTRVAAGEDVDIKEAYNTTSPKFLLNSGTEISRVDSSGTGFTEFVKIKVLEGAHKDETGWVHASTIHQEQRRK